MRSNGRRRRTANLQRRRSVRLPPNGRGKPAAATAATDSRLVDRLVEAGPKRDRPADDGRGVDPLLAEHYGSREAHDEPDGYCTEDVRLHRSPPNANRPQA